MCISVDANGSNTGDGTHISVYLHMMAGEYDDNLKWPFHGAVTVQLLNQRNNGNHYESSLIEADDHLLDEFDTTYVARVQGVQERGLGWGYPKFFPHEELAYNDDKDCQYLMNDCLKLQVNKVVVLDYQTTSFKLTKLYRKSVGSGRVVVLVWLHGKSFIIILVSVQLLKVPISCYSF